VGELTKQKQPTWWLQLVDSTAFENYDEIYRQIEAWETETDKYHIDWDPSVPKPTSIAGHGFADFAPDVEDYISQLQELLEDREYLIFSLVLNHAIIDRAGISVILVTKRIIAHINGAEMIERARRLVMASEEELIAETKKS